MDMIPYFLSMIAFGFICFCFGVYKGAQAVAERITEEFSK
jgi:hypothetical protein